MKILITGVAGLIGSRLAKWLLKNTKHKVIGIDNLSCGLHINVPDNSDRFECYWPTLGEGYLDKICKDEKPDIIYHFAAFAAEGLSPFIRCYNYQNNLLATAEVINAAIEYDVKRLVFTSSMAVYGNGSPPFLEIDTPKPIDPYGIAKYASEMDIQVAGIQHGLDWCIIRPHNVYGIGQVFNQKYRNVLAHWIIRALNGQPMLVYGDGRQTRAFSYIDDVLHCFYTAATSSAASKKIINLGGKTPITIIDAAKIVQKIISTSKIEYAESRHEVKEAWCTTQLSEEILGYVDKTPLYDGVLNMFEWIKANKDIPKGYRYVDIEVQKGLYSFWK